MPLYSYIPYLDPDINEKEKRSFSGNFIDTDDEQDSFRIEDATAKLTQRITVDTFTKKVNENLKNINSRMTDLLQDGIGGVDNICKQVRDLINDNQQVYSGRYVESCARGNDHDDRDEKRDNISATNPSQGTIFPINHQNEEKLQEIYHNNNNSVFAMQHRTVAKDDDLVAREKPNSRPTSRGLKSRKSDPKSNASKLTSKSFDATVRSFLNAKSSEKIKPAKARTKKKTIEAETKPVGESCANKRLGQIERDYQKVVENLGMVERMMACVNERLMKQKKDRKALEIVNSKEKTIEHSKCKKTPKPTDKKLLETKQKTIEHTSQKELTNERAKEDKAFKEKKIEKLPKEVMKRRRKETKDVEQSGKKPLEEAEESRIAEEIIKQMKSIEKINNDPTSTNGKTKDGTREKAEILKALNPLSRITINGSLSDIDALIDNAVMELGNLVSTEFYISRSSSDVSFNLTTEPQTMYDECNLVTSSSTSSDSSNALLGEESDKFNISQSFQELKKTYVQKIKQETTDRKKQEKKESKGGDDDNNIKTTKNYSHDRLHEEIFNDSSWNRLDQMSHEYTFTRQSSGSIDSNTNPQGGREDQDRPLSTRHFNGQAHEAVENSYAILREYLQAQTETINKDQSEEVITISLPTTTQHIRAITNSSDFMSEIKNIDTKQLDDDTLQITVTLKGEEKVNKNGIVPNEKHEQAIEEDISESELATLNYNSATIRGGQRSLSDQQNTPSRSSREKAKTPKSPKDEEYLEGVEESMMTDDYQRKGFHAISTNTITKSKQTKANFERNPKKPIDTKQFDPIDIKEIKKMENNFSECSSYSSFSSFQDGMFCAKEDQSIQEVKVMDPMKPVSLVCKKLISDLVVEEETINLEKIMNGYFNATLIRSLVCRVRRPRSVRIHTPIHDPDLRTIVPEVHRKRAIPDLHERMEFQIRQTDSFDGFLSLMNKTRRKALIRQAERQDHSVRCQMRTCFRKKYPFRVVTASVPAGYDGKFKDKKEPEKKYINSLWFSPKDFKLRRNSRIFNRKRMEMYCQSLNKTSIIPKCKCSEAASRETKKIEKASNYSILVQSGTPLGRRPNTPRRWIQLRPPSQGDTCRRPRLHHCDILDDLTLKDLAPFNAEYPRNDDRHLSISLQGSLLYKLACGGQKGDADGTLMDLITPKLSCTQNNCKICKNKLRSDKKPAKKIRNPRKSGDESSFTSTKTDLQNLTPKAATQLLIQNIGEIKTRKSSTKSQVIEKNTGKNQEAKTNRSAKGTRKNPRRVKDSKSTIHQKLEENMLKRVFQNHHAAVAEFAPRSTTPLQKMAFKDIDHFQKILKVPELYSRPPGKRSNVTKLFPYINDPDNKVFQNITVLPVKVFYNFDSLKVSSDKGNQGATETCGKPTINIASLSETEELEVSTIERRRPSTAEDKNNKKKETGRRRIGTPKSPTIGSRQSPNKFANLPQNPAGPPPPIPYPIDITLSRKSREIIGGHQETKIAPRRSKFGRSSSLGKTIESENIVSQMQAKRPWKPASRRPRTPKTPPLPTRIRSKEKSNLQLPPIKTISTGWISSRQNTRAIQEVKDQKQMQTLVNKDKKIRLELNPTKNFYDMEMAGTKPHTTRAPIQKYRPLSPRQRVMVDHLRMLRNRNGRLQGNIQKAINVIEEKMVDVLSTNDQNVKKKTIDRMEREINKVLKMINEQNCLVNKREENKTEVSHPDIKKTNSRTDDIKCISFAPKQMPEEECQTNAKALISHTVGVKVPKPPKKRSISRIVKFQCRPSTVEDGKRFDVAEENKLFRINEGAASEEEETICERKEEEKLEIKKREELYPSPIVNEEGDIPFCPVLRCPTPKTSHTKLSNHTKNISRKMSRQAFGKFADVVRTKTRLIIDMTERIDMDDTNLLPNPKVTSALPAILARSTNLPVITTIHQPRPSDLMSTTVSSIVSVHQTPIEKFVNGANAEISEFVSGCRERSITSISESESYTWRKIEQAQSVGLECSTCSLKRKLSHDLTPFMRALNNLKAGRLFEKRHQLLPIEDTSPNFGKMMSFLERLSRVKENIDQARSRDVQLMWNPEKRCSFHNFIEGTKKLRFRKDTKAISDHSMIQYPATSISELFSEIKTEENLPDSVEDTKKETMQNPESNKKNQLTIIEKNDNAEKNLKEPHKSELEDKQEEQRVCKLVFSEVQLISICNGKNFIKKQKKRCTVSSDYKKPIRMLKDDRYSSILKLFYLVFYTFVYFCMTAMNFSC